MKFNHKFSLSWATVFAAIMFGMLLLEFASLIAPIRGSDLFSTYGIALIFIMAGLYFAKRPSDTPFEIKLYILYLVWALVTRWLNRDIYLFIDRSLMVTMLFSFLFLCVGTVISDKQRETYLDCLSLVFIAFFTLAALAGIFVSVTDTYIHLPPENVWITVIKQGTLYSLNMLSTVRLYSASWFFITWGLLIYQLFKRKNLLLRVLLIVCIAIIHITITLFHSRNIQICLSGCYGMLMLLVFTKLLSEKQSKLRLLVLPAVTVVSIVLCFFSFNLCLTLISGLHSVAEPQFKSYYENQAQKIDPEYFGIALRTDEKASESVSANDVTSSEAAAPKQISNTTDIDFGDSRSISENKTLSHRTEIWESALIAIKEQPSIALYGRLSNQIMPIINDILRSQVNPKISEYMTHMHNAYFQVLMLFGIPGLLLILLWTILIAKKMLAVFFSSDDRFTMAEKALSIPITGLFVFNLAETIIFAGLGAISGYTFYIITGLFLGCYYGKSK